MERIFILSPANAGGERASLLYNSRAGFSLAHRMQAGERVPLAEVFSFVSGLYFRGKFTYAATFGKAPAGLHPAYVITSNRGLLPAIELISIDDLKSFGSVPIDSAEPAYAKPMQRDCRKLARATEGTAEVVLLGSVSTKKYTDVLLQHFGERLLFPPSFVGRGDMSRGGLLLRCVAEGKELEYAPVLGATLKGKRPEKLPPKSWGYKTMSGETNISATVCKKDS
ncbi:MAG: hypothetical protein ACO1QB_07340 [Verrucomicrobiales bacterium]